ncbi:site-specific integrase [Bacillus massilinigeriensis]|uniref:hypothetical protein n=1 Tax=Bacillus massilionigeriensis TaxID=1805475 RepID=UPI00096ADD7B|nr:hypothetical protein [Bacillus massilionigeriensis]
MQKDLSNRFRNENIVEEEKNQDLKIFIDENNEIIPGCGFSVRSEIWDLHFRETLAMRGPKLDFSSLPLWIRHFVQDYIENLLTVKKFTNLTIYNHLQACINFAEFLIENRPDILSVKQLDFHVGKSFLKWLKTKTDSNDVKAKKQGHLRGFSKFMHKYRPGMTQDNFGFPTYFISRSKKIIRSYSDYKTKDVPIDTVKQIMSAISQEEERQKNILRTAKDNCGNRKTNAKNYLIYCQALKILIASGRRTSHVLMIDKDPLKEPTSGEAAGVWLTWKETKTDLDEQDVFIPFPLDQEVREAVKYVKELRKDLLEYVDEEDKNKLFLVMGFRNPGGGPHAHPIHYKSFRNWVNGYKNSVEGVWRPGFLERYNIIQDGEIYKFKLHSLRHTRFKQLRMGGAGIGTIQNDAKHLSTDMTIVYSTDDEVAAADFQKATEKKRVNGLWKRFNI